MGTTQTFSVSYFSNPYITKGSIIFRYLIHNTQGSRSPTECCITSKKIHYFLLTFLIIISIGITILHWIPVYLLWGSWYALSLLVFDPGARKLDIEIPFIWNNEDTCWLLGFQWMHNNNWKQRLPLALFFEHTQLEIFMVLLNFNWYNNGLHLLYFTPSQKLL